MALDFPVGTDFPANGDQIPDGHEYKGFYWDATTGVWKRVCEPDEPFDPTEIECIDDGRTTSLGTLPYQSSGDTLTADGVKGNITSGALASTLTELEFGADADETVFVVDGRLQLTNTTLDTPTDTFEITAVDGSKVTVTYKDGDAATVYNTDDELTVVHNGGLQVNADCLFCEGDERSICEEINLLQNQVIELEEEIDAIAPSVEYGTWEWQNPTADNATRPPAAGTFYLAKDGPGGPVDPVITTQYLDTEVIVIHNNEYVAAGDTDPVDSHSWSDADDGKLIQLFDRADPDFFLGTILSTQVEADHVRIRVERIQTSGIPNDNADPDTGDFLTRVNIFNPPSGGTASEFVKVIGDTMTGQLKFYTEQADDSFDYRVPTDGSKDIRFTTKRLDLGFENTTSLYKPGYTDTLVCSGALMSKSSLYTSSYLYGIIFKNDGTRVTKAPRIYFNRTVDSNDNVTDEFGALRWNGTNILRWKDTEITIDKPIDITNNALATDDQHAIHRGYVNKVGRMAGLQLGQYNYRRSSDSFNAGAIKSNTTTNPANITQISLYKNNYDGITFGASFLLNLIVPKMYLHIMDKAEASYVGRIDDVYIISNGIQMQLTPVTGLISGSVYYNNKYDVTISYNKFGVNKFPQ